MYIKDPWLNSAEDFMIQKIKIRMRTFATLQLLKRMGQQRKNILIGI